jgi:pilus assembly protein CpaC
VNTEVELADGESFMIGGLLDKTTNDSFQKIPFIGDIPILGKLFQSELRTKNDTELIVVVTPEIVSPYPADAKVPNPNFPVAFLPPNSNTAMHQPDAKTPENTLPASPASIPVETLVDSMKPEKPLIIESGAGGFGTGGAAINSGAASSSTAGAAPPQQ